MKAAAEEATDALEETYAIATKGAADYASNNRGCPHKHQRGLQLLSVN